MKKKVVKKFVFEGLGFPVVFLNTPVREVRGEVALDLNLNKVQKAVLRALSLKPIPLNGNEIRFIRQYLELTYVQFAKVIGVTHPAVVKWEKKGNKTANITPSTELYIRLYISEFLGDTNEKFRGTFIAFNSNQNLKKPANPAVTPQPLVVETNKLCA
ncbi:MAG: hypothetical protein ChlgKO_07970 [Chlamydiales bacterium]